MLGFYRNYDSIRYVGDLLVMRLKQAPNDGAARRAQRAVRPPVLERRRSTAAEPFDPERREDDKLDLARIAFTFAKHGYGDLRELIDLVNSFVEA